MINKKLALIMLFMAVFVLSSINPSIASARDLKNNFYFTMPPDSSKCLTVNLPSDIGVYEDDRIRINITSDAETNIKFIDVAASPTNLVTVPLCFLSTGRMEGDFSSYLISIVSDKSGLEVVKGGFCINSNTTRTATGRPQGSICDLIIRDEKFFDVFFQYGDRIPAKKDSPIKIPVRVYSQNKLDIELTVKSDLEIEPKNQIVRLEPRKWTTFEFTAPPVKAGNYNIDLTAEAVVNGNFCDSKRIPFCKKEISSTIMVDSAGLSGWYFYVTPTSYSAFDTRPVDYTATIENYGDTQDFTVDVKLPEGLASDFTKTKEAIPSLGQRDFKISISPQIASPESFEIDFTAKADSEKTAKSYLSFRDTEARIKAYWSNIRDTILPELRPVIDAKIQSFISSYREKGINTEEYQQLLDLLESAKGQIFVGNIQPLKYNVSSRQPIKKLVPINPYILIIPLAVVLIIVTVLLYARKGKPNDAGAD